MNILVLGGTRFFGKELVTNLVKEGHSVTIATRGNRELPFPNIVSKLIIERSSLSNVITDKLQNWDAVYDQICYSSKDAQVATEIFSGKIGKLIMASSEAVYPDGYDLTENAFNPYQHLLKMGARNDFSYADGKRNAEAYYFQNAKFPVVAVRTPFVFGKDDYTNRLKGLIEAINEKEKLKKPNLNARISVISSADIGYILTKLASINIIGGINASPREPISIKRFLEVIENTTKRQAIFASNNEQYFDSDFLLEHDQSMNSDLLSSFGIEATPIESWFANLVAQVYQTNH